MPDPRIVKSESSSILKVKDGQTQEILSNFLREGETQMAHGLSHPRPGNGGGPPPPPPSVPPTAPQNLTATPTANGVRLSWDPPADEGSGVTGYTISMQA